MKTIFDHHLSPGEVKRILGSDSPEFRKAYLDIVSRDGAYADLYRLYILRGDHLKAEEYLQKIEDGDYRFQTSYRDVFSTEELHRGNHS